MIGIYNYTVYLTFMSLASAVSGVVFAYHDKPSLAIIALMFSGFCDLFDGKVARTKKRNNQEVGFGIELDSLTDVIAFGLLPAFIGYSVIENSRHGHAIVLYFVPIMILYVLFAVVRLAYFNVITIGALKEDHFETTKTFTGLPVTSAALIFPFVFVLKPFLKSSFPYVYMGVLFVVAILFVSRFKVKKPGLKLTIVYSIIGLLMIAALVIMYLNKK